MRIALLSTKRFSGSLLAERGLGGSESSAIYLMRALAHRGHSVTIYANIDDTEVTDNVCYRSISEFELSQDFDLLIFFRTVMASILDKNRSRIKLFWSTDVPSSGFPPIDFNQLQGVICISPFQQSILLAFYPALHREKTFILDHGIVEDDYYGSCTPTELPQKAGNRLLYCTVPCRGVEHLARLFPSIRRQVPDAELIITSDYSLWGESPGNEGYRRQFVNMAGVQFLGKVPREQLVRLQLSSKILAYPCVYAEGFCISAIECMAAGAVPVTTDYGALGTTIGDCGRLISGCPGQQVYDDTFVCTVVRLLKTEEERIPLARSGRQRTFGKYTWRHIADSFEDIVDAVSRPEIPASGNSM
jgi:glycosyltransferase involved in cell wall biosynthesis